jgi:hypothetical protein
MTCMYFITIITFIINIVLLAFLLMILFGDLAATILVSYLVIIAIYLIIRFEKEKKNGNSE